MLKSNLVFTLALIGFVASSACSRSGTASPPPPPITQSTEPSPTPAPNQAVPGSQSELDNDSGNSAQDPKSAPTPDPQDPQTAPQNPQQPPQTAPQNPNTAPQTPPRTAPAAPPQLPPQLPPNTPVSNDPTAPEIVIYDPTGMKPSDIFASSRAQGAPVVGGESDLTNGSTGEPLFYSGAGQDSLREQLQTWVQMHTRADRVQRDRDFAKRVVKGQFSVKWPSRSMNLDITIKRSSGPVVYHFAGQLSNQLLFRGGDLRHGNNVAVEAACMDANGGCQTVYVKVQDAKGGLVRTAHMLIRQTPAWLYTHAAGFGASHNPEFDALLETMVRTDRHAGGLNALNDLVLRTSETINGQATFAVEMGIRSSQNTQLSLNFGGALVKPAADIQMSSDIQILRSSSPAAATIRDVTMTNNDGRGNLTLAVTVRKSTARSSEDTMDLTFARIHQPVRQLILK